VNDGTSRSPASQLYNLRECGSTSQTCGNQQDLRFSMQIVGYRTLHEGTAPVFPVKTGETGMKVLIDGDARKHTHDFEDIAKWHSHDFPVYFPRQPPENRPPAIFLARNPRKAGAQCMHEDLRSDRALA
jgi:hypothetical protein